MYYAHLLSNTGRFEEALAQVRRARELDPANPFVSTLEGQFLMNAGRLDDALTTLQETAALAPDFWFPHLFAEGVYIFQEKYPEAIVEGRRASELSSWQTVSLAYEGFALAKSGKAAEAQAIIDRLHKFSQEPGRWIPPYHFALIYNGLGNTDQTVLWLNKAIEQHDPKLTFLKVEPSWNNLRNDHRFQDIMKRAGF